MPKRLQRLDSGRVCRFASGRAIQLVAGASTCGCPDSDCCPTDCDHFLHVTGSGTQNIRYFCCEDPGTTLDTATRTYSFDGYLTGFLCPSSPDNQDGAYTGSVLYTYDGVLNPTPQTVTHVHLKDASGYGDDGGPGWFSPAGIGSYLRLTTDGDTNCLAGLVINDGSDEEGEPGFDHSDEEACGDTGVCAATTSFSTEVDYDSGTCSGWVDYRKLIDATGSLPITSDYCDEVCHDCALFPNGASSILLSLTVDGTPYSVPLFLRSDDGHYCNTLSILPTVTIAGQAMYLVILGERVSGVSRFRLLGAANPNGSGTIYIDYSVGCSSAITSSPDTQMLGTYTQYASTAFELAHTITAVSAS